MEQGNEGGELGFAEEEEFGGEPGDHLVQFACQFEVHLLLRVGFREEDVG